MAAAEAIVGKYLAKYMLHTLFPWSNDGKLQSNLLKRTLEGLLNTNSSKEAILRAYISITELSNIQGKNNSAINLVVEEVTETCAPILSLPQKDCTSAFRDDLTKILKDALQV
jgi:hypothetical protein